MTNFHDNLKEAMSIKGMSTREVADKTGIKEGTISNYLKTNGSIPNIVNGYKIADALGVSVKFLVTGFEASEEEVLDKTNTASYKRALKTINNLINLPEEQRSTFESIIADFSSKYHTSK